MKNEEHGRQLNYHTYFTASTLSMYRRLQRCGLPLPSLWQRLFLSPSPRRDGAEGEGTLATAIIITNPELGRRMGTVSLSRLVLSAYRTAAVFGPLEPRK